MSNKFINIRRIFLPIITIVIILSQSTQVFALTPTDITSLMQVSPTVAVELYEGAMPSQVAFADTTTAETHTNPQSSQAQDIFADVHPSDWYYQSVTDSYKQGLIAGIGNQLYAPKNTITTAEYLTTLARLLKGGDENIQNLSNSKNWYDKYINICQEEGIIVAGEKVNYTEGIKRQDMMKFTCRALKLEPTTDISKVVFADVDEKDSKYVNLSYLEYLTEGTGHDANGQKIFGYNTVASRSELATMILRVKEYRTDPQAFKEVKAAARQAADAKYEADQAQYTYYNGYKIPNDFLSNIATNTIDVEFWGWAHLGNSADFNIMQQILSSKVDLKVVKQAISYGQTQTIGDRYTKQLDTKKFKTTNGYTIIVERACGDANVDFQVVKN